MAATALQFATRAVITLMRHPATQAYAKHLLRSATAELVRHIRNGTRPRKSL